MTVCLFHCRNLSQHLEKLFKSVSARKSNLKFSTVTSTKDTQLVTNLTIDNKTPIVLINGLICTTMVAYIAVIKNFNENCKENKLKHKLKLISLTKIEPKLL